MSNMFKKRDLNKISLADDILNAGKQDELMNQDVIDSVTDVVNNNVNRNTNNIVNNGVNNDNSIVIPKKEEVTNYRKRQTYHLSENNINNISKYAEEAGMGKSEFLNFLLDTVFRNLKIE